ncbi:hypothetical protein PINS_up006470 [Pythium insidiosum]|nr:hypothetical protein PINS_up006470 [Pythium insidiosum]
MRRVLLQTPRFMQPQQQTQRSVPTIVRCMRPSASRSSSESTRAAACFSSTPAGPSPSISLTPSESQLFDFLLYIQHLYAPSTQLRVAGGWVRDKLRGAESEDIDIVLDNLYGRQFAQLITRFQRERRLPLSSVGVVKANADKSKHLEVAQVRVEGLMVDLVHLRGEQYAPDSRIPSHTSFVAPHEDALRRDITINALFYNLHTREVEDWTGRGLADLRDGVIRTPLAPLQTFLDDPLRVLRVVRFAAEFGFRVDAEIDAALRAHAAIRDAMRRKVSRERVGTEVRKMLSGADPTRAFALLADLELLDVVFHSDDDSAAVDGSTSVVDAETARAWRQRFPWTRDVAARAERHLAHLQASRLSTHQHAVSFVESTAALLAPFLLPTHHAHALQTALDAAALTTESSCRWTQRVTEPQLATAALEALARRDRVLASLPLDAVVELLKTNLKWPKPAAKRIALILEALATFPTACADHDESAFHVELFLWSRRYHDVLSPAIAILLTELPEPERVTLVATLDAVTHAMSKGDAAVNGTARRRVDGQAIRSRLGGQAGRAIAVALEVLSVWEFVWPEGSVEDELAFLDGLKPQLEVVERTR